jgi:hypothetical protein
MGWAPFFMGMMQITETATRAICFIAEQDARELLQRRPELQW